MRLLPARAPAGCCRAFAGGLRATSRLLPFCLRAYRSIGVAYADLLEAVDLNPIAVLPSGRGALVLDALVIPHKPTNQGAP